MTGFASGKGVATHTSSLPIPMDRGARGLQSMGSQRDWTHIEDISGTTHSFFLGLIHTETVVYSTFHGMECFDFAFVDLI